MNYPFEYEGKVMIDDRTIAAISTPFGKGGISVIRVSGSDSFKIASKLYKGKEELDKIKTHTINYGKIIDPIDNQVIDHIMLIKMKGPETYTGEDTIEINCHGGITITKNILQLLYTFGACPAEPGEFTKKAFLNGKMDLVQAEAVIDLINAETEKSRKVAVNQLEGNLSKIINKCRKNVITILSHIAVTIDYPEYDIEEATIEKVKEKTEEIINEVENIVKSFEKGRVLREGLRISIVGKPNAGKSSILNALVGKRRAIVSHIPGTTRDVISEYIDIQGLPVKISDTAGLRETEELIEKTGVELAYKNIKKADIILLVVDPIDEIDDSYLGKIESSSEAKIIVVINKIDITPIKVIEETEKKYLRFSSVKTSTISGEGIEEIYDIIQEIFAEGKVQTNDQILLTNVRHWNHLRKALESLLSVVAAAQNKMPVDILEIDLKNAAQELGMITGDTVSDEIISSIFKQFCVGK